MAFVEPDFYGSSTVGERGQIVLPIDLRKKYNINPGDKLLVLGGEQMGAWGVIMIKSEVLGKIFSLFGNNIAKILEKSMADISDDDETDAGTDEK